jgi:protein-S-isoprenylcysteine O-methyltransferase Ste14
MVRNIVIIAFNQLIGNKMNIFGRATISPIFFFTGKISGYVTWILYILSILKIDAISRTQSLLFIISIILFIIGFVITVISLFNLGKSTRLGLPDDDTKFVTSGLYGISRNPMYLGFDLLTLSSMVYFCNMYVFLLGLYSLIIYHFIILGEEKYLEKTFGAIYSKYKKEVNRY